MKQLFAKILIAFFIVVISPIAVAQQKLDIVQIQGQFIQASFAASRCIKPDEETLARFFFNYRMVSVRAREVLERQNPEQSDQQIIEGLKQRTSAAEKAIDKVIREKGCADPRIQDLLKRFEIQANLKL